MSAIYDNWEKLVAAVLRKEELWQLFHDQSRTPSVLSENSSLSSSFNLGSFDLGSSSRSQTPLSKLVLISDFSSAFGVDDLHLASAKLLGRGTFGKTYGVALDNGVTIVVKRLKPKSVSEQEFKHQMDIVGNVRHENVAALRAYYSSEHEKVMLYDYYSKGSVYALLHGKTGKNRAQVDWETRLKIAIGAAKGIAEIHKQAGGTLVHGNIKSSNIFLNLKHYGSVSDLGLANMIETAFMPTARCYAPEVKSTRNVSQASDVYSFGIVLLELLTRKSTEHISGVTHDLVKLVGSIKSTDKAVEVFDADLLKHLTIKDDMVKMLQIGLECVSKSIKKRPKMSAVVKLLDDIGKVNPESDVPYGRKFLFVDDATLKYNLEDMLFVESLVGDVTFRTCYRARLEDGVTLMVKRLRDASIAFKDFQQHMEVIGGLRHKNIAELKAYYFSTDKKLLVYDYYHQGSLFSALHGTDILLDWETRLKIALDAARGITHIHRQYGWKLVHGNINSSNIFINGEKDNVVSDVGLAKLVDPIKIPVIGSIGYCAPEVTDTTQVSQASDVYSFGVVLLELLTGEPGQHITDGVTISLVDRVKSVPVEEWTTKLFDAELLQYPDEEAMLQMLQIAIHCVATIPDHRPEMSEILKVLEEISGVVLSHQSSLEDVLEEVLENL